MGLGGLKVLSGLLAALQSIFRRQRAPGTGGTGSKIREEFDGGNYRELAHEIWTYRALGEIYLFGKLDNLDDDMEGQMSIYDYPEAF